MLTYCWNKRQEIFDEEIKALGYDKDPGSLGGNPSDEERYAKVETGFTCYQVSLR